MKKIAGFLKDVRQEMKRVSWPSKSDVKEGTTVVITLSALVAAFLFVVDFGFDQLISAILV